MRASRGVKRRDQIGANKPKRSCFFLFFVTQTQIWTHGYLRVRRNFVAKTQGVRKYVSRCCCSVDHHRAEVFDGSSGRGGSGSGRGRGRRLSRATPEVVAMAVASAIGEEGDAIHKSL